MRIAHHHQDRLVGPEALAIGLHQVGAGDFADHLRPGVDEGVGVIAEELALEHLAQLIGGLGAVGDDGLQLVLDGQFHLFPGKAGLGGGLGEDLQDGAGAGSESLDTQVGHVLAYRGLDLGAHGLQVLGDLPGTALFGSRGEGCREDVAQPHERLRVRCNAAADGQVEGDQRQVVALDEPQGEAVLQLQLLYVGQHQRLVLAVGGQARNGLRLLLGLHQGAGSGQRQAKEGIGEESAVHGCFSSPFLDATCRSIQLRLATVRYLAATRRMSSGVTFCTISG